jgi:hypothetical protein
MLKINHNDRAVSTIKKPHFSTVSGTNLLGLNELAGYIRWIEKIISPCSGFILDFSLSISGNECDPAGSRNAFSAPTTLENFVLHQMFISVQFMGLSICQP